MQQQIEFNRGAVRPIQCISDACELLKGNYGSYLGVLIVGILLMILSACIPLAPLIPPLICGMYLCSFAMMRGEAFGTSTLFKGFDFFLPSFLASLVTTIPVFALSVVMQVGIGGFSAVFENVNIENNPDPQDVLPIVFGILGFVAVIYVLIIVVSLVLGTLMAFVNPLIVDKGIGAIEAIKLSFRAVMGNFFGIVGLMILAQILVFAGVMLFYVGALFIAPVIFVAWAVAYRRVFPQYDEQGAEIPPRSNSKAGMVLTLVALLMFALSITGMAVGGVFVYKAISDAIERKANEQQNKPSYPPPYPTSQTEGFQVESTGDDSTSAKTINRGVVNGQAISLPKPNYPAAARAVNAKGSVNVSIEIDTNGKVVSANAVSGHPLLRSAAVSAARRAKFRPQLLGGELVKVKGVLVYNFDGSVGIED